MGQIIFYARIGENYLPSAVGNGVIIASACVVFAVLLALYLLRSIGIYTLAKRNGVSHGWLAFLPAVWVYVVTKLIKEMRFFGKSYDKFALWFAIIAGVTQLISLAFYFLTYFPLVGYLLSGGTVYAGEISEVQIKTLGLVEFWHGDFYVLGSNFQYPYVNFWGMIKVINVIAKISNVFDLIYVIIEVNLFITLFRKFWPNHYLLAAVFSIFLGLSPYSCLLSVKKSR